MARVFARTILSSVLPSPIPCSLHPARHGPGHGVLPQLWYVNSRVVWWHFITTTSNAFSLCWRLAEPSIAHWLNLTSHDSILLQLGNPRGLISWQCQTIDFLDPFLRTMHGPQDFSHYWTRAFCMNNQFLSFTRRLFHHLKHVYLTSYKQSRFSRALTAYDPAHAAVSLFFLFNPVPFLHLLFLIFPLYALTLSSTDRVISTRFCQELFLPCRHSKNLCILSGIVKVRQSSNTKIKARRLRQQGMESERMRKRNVYWYVWLFTS